MKKHIDNKLKPPKSFFEWCENQIPIYIWANKKKKIKSSERKGKLVVKKQLRANSRLDIVGEFYPFAIILVTSKRIEIQSYAYYQDIVEGKESLEVRLTNFEKFENDKHYKLYRDWQGRVSEGLIPNYSMLGGPYTNTKFYPNNWKNRVKEVSELKYLDFKNIQIERWSLSMLYRDRMKIEFLQKIGANKMADEIVKGKVDMRIVTQNWLRKHKHELKTHNMSFATLELKNRIEARKGKFNPEIEKYMHYKDVQDIPHKIGTTRFQNYLIKQKCDFSFYRDYLEMMEELEIPLINDNALLPKDLTAAHDQALELIIEKQEKDKPIVYASRKEILKKMIYDLDSFHFKPPLNSLEMVKEGKILNHCVGTNSYTEKHLKGDTTIVFVRSKEKPTTPLYTMELDGTRIVQLRGKNNKSAPKEVYEVAEKYVEKIREVI